MVAHHILDHLSLIGRKTLELFPHLGHLLVDSLDHRLHLREGHLVVPLLIIVDHIQAFRVEPDDAGHSLPGEDLVLARNVVECGPLFRTVVAGDRHFPEEALRGQRHCAETQQHECPVHATTRGGHDASLVWSGWWCHHSVAGGCRGRAIMTPVVVPRAPIAVAMDSRAIRTAPFVRGAWRNRGDDPSMTTMPVCETSSPGIDVVSARISPSWRLPSAAASRLRGREGVFPCAHLFLNPAHCIEDGGVHQGGILVPVRRHERQSFPLRYAAQFPRHIPDDALPFVLVDPVGEIVETRRIALDDAPPVTETREFGRERLHRVPSSGDTPGKGDAGFHEGDAIESTQVYDEPFRLSGLERSCGVRRAEE